MKLVVDVHYNDTEDGTTQAQVAGVGFDTWTDAQPNQVWLSQLAAVSAYQAGQFYQRELPCLLTLLNEHAITPECIVIDGYVFLDGHHQPGLGKHLYDALHGSTPIIGVAKKRFKDISDDYTLLRGNSQMPLFITAVGMTASTARECVANMHGQYRLPTLLKRVDQLCRGIK